MHHHASNIGPTRRRRIPYEKIPPVPPLRKGGTRIPPFDKGGLGGILDDVDATRVKANRHKSSRAIADDAAIQGANKP